MKIFRNPDALWREEDLPQAEALRGLERGEDVSGLGTSVILAQGSMHALNVLGTEVWKLCDGRTREEIADLILERFDAEPLRVKEDITAFLDDLKARGLVREE